MNPAIIPEGGGAPEVLTGEQADQLLSAMADHRLQRYVQQLRTEAEEEQAIRARMAELLSGVANALHGGPLENGCWSWHDLPDLAKKLREENEHLDAMLREEQER